MPGFLLYLGAILLEIQAWLHNNRPIATRNSVKYLLNETTFDNSKLRSTFDWYPRVEWAEAQEITLDWIRKMSKDKN